MSTMCKKTFILWCQDLEHLNWICIHIR